MPPTPGVAWQDTALIVDVAFTAAGASDDQLRNRVVCVLDVLRASSTITAALAAGARAVYPVATIAEAKTVRSRLQAAGEPALLAGERGGDPPPGFDFGNSPLDMQPSTVADRNLVLTTTNGTLALSRARAAGAAAIYVGAFVNVTAAANVLERALRVETAAGVLLYASGSEGSVSLEDSVCAGQLVTMLQERLPGLKMTDAARVARGAFTATVSAWPKPLLHGDHARRLMDKGYGADVEWCLQSDQLTTVGVVAADRVVTATP